LNEDLYAQKLAHFKENEKPEIVLLIGDDPNLIRIIVAWTNTTVTRAVASIEHRTSARISIGGCFLYQNTLAPKSLTSSTSPQFRLVVRGVYTLPLASVIILPSSR